MIDEILAGIFLASIFTFSLWTLLALLPERKHSNTFSKNLSVVIPAHNEESCIKETVESVFKSEYAGQIEVIIVDDGSKDATPKIVEELTESNKSLRLLKTSHAGKAAAANKGVGESNGEVIILLDADSRLEKDALQLLANPFSDEHVGAVSGIIAVASNNNPLVWFQDFEYVLSSMWRYIFDKMKCTYILPGFAAFRKSVLEEVGGFQTDTLSEDFDIGLRIRKLGRNIVMSKAVMHTNVPQTIRGVASQRFRWGRGTIQVMRKHKDMFFNLKHGLIGFYGLPNQAYYFVQGFVIIPITIYQILDGYLNYFALQNNLLSLQVAKYFFDWFSMIGTVKFIHNTLTGAWTMAWTFPIFLMSWSLTNIYNIIAIKKMRRARLKVFLTLIFFFPYFLFTLSFYTLPFFAEINPFKKRAGHVNIWEKNK
ncbi:MAG TPA: glycosyltransferase family 2 protein [Candidatus Altiarchaeales archaeon]|nr:glycosyltransferase family 2 protein [Candidatus Altiarchaeales archaeon]